MIANKQQPKVVSIAHKRNYTAVTITVTHRDVKEATPHPWLSPVSRALCNSLAIDGAEVLHETIRLFREGKKDVVIATPESVQRFEYLYDLHGKGQPFNFSVNVPAQLVLHEEVAQMLDRLNDYNWEKVFEAAGQEHKDGYNYRDNPVNLSRAVPTDTTTPVTEFTREDVAEILHIEDGENDEQDWIAVVRLADGRFAYLEGGCDYTGWDCQSGCCAIVAENYEDIVRFGCSESARTRFGI